MNRLTGVLALVACAAAGSAVVAQPVAARRPVTNTYHGEKVVDDYQWLEDWTDPAVQAWSSAQNDHARSVLDGLPGVEQIRARVTEVLSAEVVTYSEVHGAGGRLFSMKRQPPKQQSFLVVMDSPEHAASARVLVDPNTIDSSGQTTIDWYRPSPDGKLVAVSMSVGGTESGDVHVFDTETGAQVHEVIERVNGGTAGGDLAWWPDSSGFFYTRYPRKGERPEADMDFYTQIWSHTLGQDPAEDRYEYGKDFPRIAEIQLGASETGRLLATVQYGDGGTFAIYLRSPGGEWTRVADYADGVVQANFGPDDDIYVVSRQGAPRGKVGVIPVDRPTLSAMRTVLPEGDDTVISEFWAPASVLVHADRMFVTYQTGGPSEIRVFDLDGNPASAPKQLAVSAVDGMTEWGDAVLYRNVSFVDPPAWYAYDPKNGSTRRTSLRTESPIDFSGVEVVREFAKSKDGTPVPVNIIKPKGIALDGNNPCVVNGYGGYGVNIEPSFSASRKVLLEQGVIYAIANIRGGGEYGKEWHDQGRLTTKQNVFDDFAAAVKHMIDRGYTNHDRVATIGGSNGGLLMGTIVTQHPELVKAVVSFVGIYDMLRVELSPNGAFNVPEFGTVKDEAQYRALRAYSPFHNVKDGTAYPAVLFLTGANDPRVDPMHSRKMTARLQAATSSEEPILLRTSMDSGHGGGTALKELIAQTVDVDAFLFWQLGVDYKPVN